MNAGPSPPSSEGTGVPGVCASLSCPFPRLSLPLSVLIFLFVHPTVFSPPRSRHSTLRRPCPRPDAGGTGVQGASEMRPWEKWRVQLLPGQRSAHLHPTLSRPFLTPESFQEFHGACLPSLTWESTWEWSPSGVDPTRVDTIVPLGLPAGLCLLSATPHRAWALPLPEVCVRAQHPGGRLGGRAGWQGLWVGGHPSEGPGDSQGPAEPLLSPSRGERVAPPPLPGGVTGAQDQGRGCEQGNRRCPTPPVCPSGHAGSSPGLHC